MNPKVDAYLSRQTTWQEEQTELRTIVLGCKLTEELKWGKPCYTFEGCNIVLIHAFKDYCALLFMKGALLDDPHGILVQQTATVQSARQIRFANVQGIIRQKAILKATLRNAIEVEKSGVQVAFKDTAEFAIPEEFQQKIDASSKLKKAFAALTPGRQRSYLLFFSGAKQSKTRESRIEKSVPTILAGKGLNDV